MSCAETRRDLAAFHVGALEPEAAARVGEHLLDCDACHEELLALVALEADLAAPPARAFRRPLVLVAAAAAAVLLAVALVETFGAKPLRLVRGHAMAGGRAVDAVAALPFRVPVDLAPGAILEAPGGRRLTVEQGARVVLRDAARVEVLGGDLAVDAAGSDGAFEVATPRGVITIERGRTRLRVEDEIMDGRIMAAGGVVTVAVVAGVVWFQQASQGETDKQVLPPKTETVISSSGTERRAEAPPAVDPERERMQAKLRELEAQPKALNEAIARLKAENEALRLENERLDAEVRQSREILREKRDELLAGVVAQIEALKSKGGLSTFVTPGATAQLVSDLKSLGEAGVDAVAAMLSSEDEATRFLAAKLLEDLAHPRSIEALRAAALKEGEGEMVANMASHALALMNSPEAVAALREIADKTEHLGARVNSLYGLCQQGDRKGMEETMAFLRDPDASPQMKAALGAGFLLDPQPRYLPFADEVVRQFPQSERILELAIEYYRKTATPEARARLQAIAADESKPQALRNKALDALTQ